MKNRIPCYVLALLCTLLWGLFACSDNPTETGDFDKYRKYNDRPDFGWRKEGFIPVLDDSKSFGGLKDIYHVGDRIALIDNYWSSNEYTSPGSVTYTPRVFASEIGLVYNVEYERGATILRYNPKHPIMRLFKDRAFTLGSFIAGHRDRLTREGEDILSHEYGHTLQSRLFGPGYIAVMFLSPISAAGKTNKEHMKTFIERDATERSKRYGF